MNIKKILFATVTGVILSAGTVMGQTTTPTQSTPQTTPVAPTEAPMPTNYQQNGSVYDKSGTIDGKTAADLKTEKTSTPKPEKAKSIYQQNGSTYQPNGTLDRTTGTVCCQETTPR